LPFFAAFAGFASRLARSLAALDAALPLGEPGSTVISGGSVWKFRSCLPGAHGIS
jgi:hypothetical protein